MTAPLLTLLAVLASATDPAAPAALAGAADPAAPAAIAGAADPAAPAATAPADAAATPAAADAPAAAPSPAPGVPEKPALPPLPPAQRLVLNSLTILRYNPLGFEEQVRFGYQMRLYDSDSIVARDNFAFFGIAPKLNPAYAKLAPSIEVQPLSVLNLKVTAEYMAYFSTFGYLQSFPDAHDDYSDSTMAQRRDAKLNYPTSGWHLFGEALLQAKVGKFAVRNRFAAERWVMGVHAGDTTFYDATLDTLVPRDGWVLSDDADVLYLAGKWTLGLRYTFVLPLYTGVDVGAANSHHRLGPLVGYTFFDDGFTHFTKPTVLLIANWYLSHRWRTGADVSRAIPYIILGFAFQTDFLSGGKSKP